MSTHLPSSRQTHRTKPIISSSSRILPSKSAASLGTLHRTHYPAFHRYRCHLAYLEDSNTASRNHRFGYPRFPDTTFHCQNDIASNLYYPALSIMDSNPNNNFIILTLR